MVLGMSVEDGSRDCKLAGWWYRGQSIFPSTMLLKFKDFSSYKADGKPERPKENLYRAHRAQYWSLANSHSEELETELKDCSVGNQAALQDATMRVFSTKSQAAVASVFAQRDNNVKLKILDFLYSCRLLFPASGASCPRQTQLKISPGNLVGFIAFPSSCASVSLSHHRIPETTQL